ncbi:MAG: AAA family ATPase, partial [Oxalobacter sp.]|nr:AAA family ATPase [Oxalobacter sp.]
MGETWVLKAFGKANYQNTAYFNFDEEPDLKQFFASSKNPKRILQNLSLVAGQAIEPAKTLIVFDEIQDCPDVINAMKYFCEEAPEYHVACAGSLLGIALAKPASFPVGKVDFLQVNPMTFTEFLMASGDGNLVAYIDALDA